MKEKLRDAVAALLGCAFAVWMAGFIFLLATEQWKVRSNCIKQKGILKGVFSCEELTATTFYIGSKAFFWPLHLGVRFLGGADSKALKANSHKPELRDQDTILAILHFASSMESITTRGVSYRDVIGAMTRKNVFRKFDRNGVELDPENGPVFIVVEPELIQMAQLWLEWQNAVALDQCLYLHSTNQGLDFSFSSQTLAKRKVLLEQLPDTSRWKGRLESASDEAVFRASMKFLLEIAHTDADSRVRFHELRQVLFNDLDAMIENLGSIISEMTGGSRGASAPGPCNESLKPPNNR